MIPALVEAERNIKSAAADKTVGLEAACGKALNFTDSPMDKIVMNILVTMNEKALSPPEAPEKDRKSHGDEL